MPMRILLCLFLTLIYATAEERIISFDSEIHVGRDGYLNVVETITVFAEGYDIRRGIYRDFPQDYNTKMGLKQHRPLKVISVTRNGLMEPYTVEKLGSGTRIRIGSADVFLETNSVQKYTITYRTGRQLWFDKTGDELYWNVTGNFWNFPIRKASARVILPEGLRLLEAEAYTGVIGEKDREYIKTEEEDGVAFETTAQLGRNEGLTIVVRWEPGKLDARAYEEAAIWKGNEVFFLGLFLALIGFLIFVVLWFVIGRDPARGVIIPRWEPPEGFSPAAVRYLKNMGFDDRCFTAGVLSLAAKGFLKIEEEGAYDYKVTKRKGHAKERLTPDEDSLFQNLLKGAKSLILEQTNHVQISGAKRKLKATLRKRLKGEYFHNHTNQWLVGLLVCAGGLAIMTIPTEEPMAVIMMMIFVLLITLWVVDMTGEIIAGRTTWTWTVLVIVAAVIAGIILIALGQLAGVWCAITLLAVMIATIVFRFLLKAPTKAGRKALDEIDGFCEYLSVAEEDRLNLENPPERTPELFEKFLPYALALGVEQKWSEKFDDVLTTAGEAQETQTYTPSFYSGGRSGLENALTGATLGAAIGGALASSSIAPNSSGSSSGGGYSGGGGGFSGGGGGGGGGGGW